MGCKTTASQHPKQLCVDKHCIQLEIADTHDKRVRGLMFRASLPKHQGMLFIFPEEKKHGFWMRNTFIPLDIIWISSKNIIVDVVANARPEDETHLDPKRPSLYVLEVNAGEAKELQLIEGKTVTFSY